MNTDLSNFNSERGRMIILILLIILIIISGIYILLSNRETNLNLYTESSDSTNIYQIPSSQNVNPIFPTGIIIPTNSVSNNELEIVKITPQDGTSNIFLNSNIEIYFSRNFNMNEILFYSVPKFSFETKIEGNKLVVDPVQELAPGTLYSVRIDFINNPEKIRLYRFLTTGDPNQVLPDTREENVIRDFENTERINYPDIFVANNTPFENADFIANSDFEPAIPSRYYLLISSKNTNLEQVRASVNVWLQSLGLTAEQISSLDIRYR